MKMKKKTQKNLINFLNKYDAENETESKAKRERERDISTL